MFRNEREFVEFVDKALSAARYRVRREVAVGSRYRLDLLAIKDGIRKGVEVKFTNRGILDDITKSRTLLPLPEVDEMYVCGPKLFMSEDVLALAATLGVGLLAVTDAGALMWLAESKRLRPAKLEVTGSYVYVVSPRGEAVYQAAVFNIGEKAAMNVEVSMLTAGAFSAPQRSKARARRAALEGGGKWEVTLACKVKSNTRPGKHPLMVTVRADNAERADDTALFEVREPAPPQSQSQ